MLDIEMYQKLDLKPENVGCIIEAPEQLPEDFDFTDTPNSSFDFVQVFVKDPALFAEEIAEAERLGNEDAKLWAMVPKNDPAGFSKDYMTQQAKPIGLKPGKEVDFGDEWTAINLERLS